MPNKPVILTKDDINRAVDAVLYEYRHGEVKIVIADGDILEVDIHTSKRRSKGQPQGAKP